MQALTPRTRVWWLLCIEQLRHEMKYVPVLKQNKRKENRIFRLLIDKLCFSLRGLCSCCWSTKQRSTRRTNSGTHLCTWRLETGPRAAQERWSHTSAAWTSATGQGGRRCIMRRTAATHRYNCKALKLIVCVWSLTFYSFTVVDYPFSAAGLEVLLFYGRW